MNLKDEDIESFLNAEMDIAPSYNGPIVIFENIDISSLFLFFPIAKKDMHLINQAMSGSQAAKGLSIYNTMMYSWRSNGIYLSGIIMDLVYDVKSLSSKVNVNLALTDYNGKLKTLIPVTFLDAVIISAIENQDILVGNGILALMIPEGDDKKEHSTGEGYPLEDENLKGIVKDILDGTIKGSTGEPEDKESPEEDL